MKEYKTKYSKYTKDIIEKAVKDSHSISETIRSLGLTVNGGTYRMIHSRVKIYDIDTSHFTGQSWSKGKTAEQDGRIMRGGYSDEQVFIKKSPLSGGSGTKLKARLLRLGWKEECSVCGITDWQGQPLSLHIDHIDGDRTNNELSNLRFICPNCHQQTDTWGNKKRG